MLTRDKRHSNSGFTLVEVSIVLVVIGLLIGSVLVAVNILQNARITSTISTLQSIQSAVSTYNQNYGAVPGDDTKAASRFSGSGVTNSGSGNGIVGTSDSFNNTSAAAASGSGAYESRMVWSHLRAAGLIKGQGSDVAQPGNPFGGMFGIQDGAFTTNNIPAGTNVVCINQIPGSAAAIIDQRQDDGIPDKGNIRGGLSISGAAATDTYVETSVYILCTKAL